MRMSILCLKVLFYETFQNSETNGLKTSKILKTFNFLVILGSLRGSSRAWKCTWLWKSLFYCFLVVVECFLINEIFEISNKFRFSEKFWIFDSYGTFWDRVLPIKLQNFLSEGVLHNFINFLKLQVHLVQFTNSFTKTHWNCQKRKLSIFFGSYCESFLNTNQQISLRITNWIYTDFVVEPFCSSNPGKSHELCTKTFKISSYLLSE